MLDKYKKYKKDIFRVTIIKPNCTAFDIKVDLDLDDKKILDAYRRSLNDAGIVLYRCHKEPLPTVLTRIILFLEYIFLGYCVY